MGSAIRPRSDRVAPLQRVDSTPKGELKSPYVDFASVAKEGHKLYMSFDCSSCHGGGGGGGMAAPLTNPIWIYGKDDDTLFRLIALGTLEFQSRVTVAKGRVRRRPMPPFGETIKTDDDRRKVLAWIRSVNRWAPRTIDQSGQDRTVRQPPLEQGKSAYDP